MRTVSILACVLLPAAVVAQDDRAFLRERVLGALDWRALGPTTFGGRIVDIEVDPRNPAVWYVAAATGGLWKTSDGGTTFAPLLDDQPVISIGDLALAPSDPDVIYVGTGEANNQRSSYYGDGVYKSTDGGESWTHVGLAGTEHIGRVIVHPGDPDRVFVAALGALYTPNAERGVYRTTDGGASWTCVHHVDADTGCVDLAIDPQAPEVLFAASYERRRRAWDFDESGPGSGIWQSTDGGESWQRLGGGLPTGELGRIGIALCASRPATVWAIVENCNPAPATPPAVETQPTEGEDGGDRPPRRRLVGGEVWRSDDGGATWHKRHTKPVGGAPHYYYGQIRVDPSDPERAVVLGVRSWESRDGGATWKNDFHRNLHGDAHALWIDPRDPRHALIGNDGGLGETRDGGATWRELDQLPLGQFYAIGVDRRTPYTIFGGTQDNGTWAVPSRSTTQNAVGQADTFKIAGSDGFYAAVDPEDPDLVYAESQFGGLRRIDLRTGESTAIRPQAPKGTPEPRCNWMSPLAVSPHAPQTLWFGSQYVHLSRDRGDHWELVSPDLTTGDPDRLAGDVPHCTITTLDESPHAAGTLLAGTDDGRVWLTRSGGRHWTALGDRFADLPPRLWVSRVVFSPSDADAFYVAFSGYREDLREPFVYVTTDGGESFRSIANDLPESAVNVIREHPRNPSVLLVGHDHGVAASIDGGASWHPLGSGLPTVPVHDLLVHPREDDLVIGTHGRGIFVLDITPLATFDAAAFARPFCAFPPRDGFRRGRAYPTKRADGAAPWTADRAPSAPRFSYYLREDADDPVRITVQDATGRVLFEHDGSREAGLHTVTWRDRQGRGPRRRASDPPAGQFAVVFDHGEERAVFPFRVHPARGEEAGAPADDEFETPAVH